MLRSPTGYVRLPLHMRLKLANLSLLGPAKSFLPLRTRPQPYSAGSTTSPVANCFVSARIGLFAWVVQFS